MKDWVVQAVAAAGCPVGCWDRFGMRVAHRRQPRELGPSRLSTTTQTSSSLSCLSGAEPRRCRDRLGYLLVRERTVPTAVSSQATDAMPRTTSGTTLSPVKPVTGIIRNVATPYIPMGKTIDHMDG